MKKLSIFTMIGGMVLKNISRRLAPALVIISGCPVLFAADNARAQPQPSVGSNAKARPVDVKVYNGFVASGGGTPFSGFVGERRSADIMFGTSTAFTWHAFGLVEFGADITSLIFVSTAGSQSFTLNSDDGSQLFINGTLVVNNGGSHVPTAVTGSAMLNAGTYKAEVTFYECCGNPAGVDLTLPAGVKYGCAGTPAAADCNRVCVSSLTTQYGGLLAAASSLGFSSVKALQAEIGGYCGEGPNGGGGHEG